jgi:tetratricopeptide (TPR) repeat protein
VDRSGRDLSVIRNQTDGPVSLFTHGTHEGFVGVYHPHTNSGTVHVADPSELPTHKVWSWGYDRDAADWRTALSDDDSAYVELQSGLFRNQETYGFLEPQERVHVSERWLPVRDLGGITRANADGVLYMDRPSPDRVRLAFDVTHDLPDSRLVVRRGASVLLDVVQTLSPREAWRRTLDAAGSDPVTFEVTDPAGRVVLAHTEHVFDRVPASAGSIGAQRSTRRSAASDEVDALLETALDDELEGRRLTAMGRYEAALQKHPSSLALLKAAGRLGVALGWTASDARRGATLSWLEAALARNTTDPETAYYLGLALASAGRARDAIDQFESARRFRATRVPATLQLARLLARGGRLADALEQLRHVSNETGGASVIGGTEVALLRRLGRNAEARDRAREWAEVDPLNNQLRYERMLLGEQDSTFWEHLAADEERVLDIVDQYLAIGAYNDALPLLAREYPQATAREPGSVSPSGSPLVAYYRGYVKSKLGMDPGPDYRAARSSDTTYVFPNRASSFPVLSAALDAEPGDGTARFLLGSLYFSKAQVADAIDAWQAARRVRQDIPTLHRNLGLALLQQSPPDYAEARAVLAEGTHADPRNVEVYTALDAVLSATGASPRERVDALRRYPAAATMPPQLVLKLALSLAEAGDTEEAERLFHNRFFPKEEGGTSVRTVYAQVKLASARAAAAAGSCGSALATLDAISREQPDLAFTAGGLSNTLGAAPMQLQIADVEAACGRRDAASGRWETLARSLQADAAPVTMAIADAARARLGRARTAAELATLQQALGAATMAIESASTSSPGLVEYARALILSELGRADEARASWQRVFLFPDRGLSHALARSTFR